ncbi:hypothetical protein LCGC14_3037220, partial [marine sediment metagenome]
MRFFQKTVKYQKNRSFYAQLRYYRSLQFYQKDNYMKLTAQKSKLEGSVAIPASKSHTIRAIAIASLATGKSTIENPLISSDTLSAANCYEALGADINTENPKLWQVTGNGGIIHPPASAIDVANSGTTLRIAAASAALADKKSHITLTGDEQIQTRPIGPLLRSLTDLGATAIADNANDKAPITVSGRLTGGKTTVDGTTSQY